MAKHSSRHGKFYFVITTPTIVQTVEKDCAFTESREQPRECRIREMRVQDAFCFAKVLSSRPWRGPRISHESENYEISEFDVCMLKHRHFYWSQFYGFCSNILSEMKNRIIFSCLFFFALGFDYSSFI